MELEQKVCSHIFELKKIYFKKQALLYNIDTELGKLYLYAQLSPVLISNLSSKERKKALKYIEKLKKLKPKHIPSSEKKGYELMVKIHGTNLTDRIDISSSAQSLRAISTRLWLSFTQREKEYYLQSAESLKFDGMCSDVFKRIFEHIN